VKERFAFFAAAIIASASFTVMHIGLSTTVCLPAARHWHTCLRWTLCGVTTDTRSMSSRRSIAAMDL